MSVRAREGVSTPGVEPCWMGELIVEYRRACLVDALTDRGGGEPGVNRTPGVSWKGEGTFAQRE